MGGRLRTPGQARHEHRRPRGESVLQNIFNQNKYSPRQGGGCRSPSGPPSSSSPGQAAESCHLPRVPGQPPCRGPHSLGLASVPAEPWERSQVGEQTQAARPAVLPGIRGRHGLLGSASPAGKGSQRGAAFISAPQLRPDTHSLAPESPEALERSEGLDETGRSLGTSVLQT